MEAAIERFLRSGDYDPLSDVWPGDTTLGRMIRSAEILRGALLEEVRHRGASVEVSLPEVIANGEVVAFARAKLSPMVRGLFPCVEREAVLRLLEQSVVFLTPRSIEEVLHEDGSLDSAWKLANIYLGGIGAEALDAEMGSVVGLSENSTCYISMAYFAADEELSDYVVHEAAHVFHNVKRETVGLTATRRREWLLPIDYRQRETFAYACEAYSRILDATSGPVARSALLRVAAESSLPSDDRVDHAEYVSILTEAIERRNGWKTILDRCSKGHGPSPTKWTSSAGSTRRSRPS